MLFCLFLQTAATHTNANEKTSVALSWTAPPAGTGAIRFRSVCCMSLPYSMVVLYIRDHSVLGFLALQNHPNNSLSFSSSQYYMVQHNIA